MSEPADPILTILIAALGGEGGGVLMNWIVEAAHRSGLAVQATSVPGVAQRTGSTSYYIEMLRMPSANAAKKPVFALVPMPARVDVVVASELVEAGRLIERGFVSPKRTTLITSTSRVFTTAEKIQMGDGRYDGAKVDAAAEALARRVIRLDLDGLARTHATMISATMFGALAASGTLPWDRAVCENVIGDGRSAASSRAGFAAAFAAVIGPPPAVVALAASSPKAATIDTDLSDLPPSLAAVVSLGRAKAIDFQDRGYGELYVERVRRLVCAALADDPVTRHAVEEAARRLALWMAYEDIPRVADLKTRPERFAAIRRDAEMAPGQILVVHEYLKPGADEIAAMLPVSIGQRIMARVATGRRIPFAGRGITLASTGVVGFAVLRGLARMKRFRPRSLRYKEEQDAIARWLAAMVATLPRSPAFAGALAELPRLLKGYGDTHARGRRNFAAIFERVVEPAISGQREDVAAGALRKAVAAALADGEAR